MGPCGYCYIAIGSQCYHEFLLSVTTLRQVSDLPVTVITDQVADTQLNVIKVPAIPGRFGNRTYKTRLYHFSPYPATIYVDTDTLFLESLDSLFNTPFSFAARIDEAPRAVAYAKQIERDQRQISPAEVADVQHCLPPEFPFFNAGVFLFRKLPRIAELFDRWFAEWSKYKKLDQFALARALYKSNISPSHLGRQENMFYREMTSINECKEKGVRVWHFTGLKQKLPVMRANYALILGTNRAMQMGLPHWEAKEEIDKHLLFRSEDEIEEIARKTPWGFHRHWRLRNVTLETFLSATPRIASTRILHILAGEGETIVNVLRAVQKSIFESIKILILEHNPDGPDWKANPFVQHGHCRAIEEILDAHRVVYRKIFIGGEGVRARNLLYCVSGIPFLDLRNITWRNLESETARVVAGGEGTDISRRVYALTSENYRTPTQLLPDEIVRRVSIDPMPFYCVVGGLMFLEILAQLDLFELHLFDLSLSQALYATVILNGIVKCSTIDEFDNWLARPSLGTTLETKISYFWHIDALRESIQNSQRHLASTEYEYRWRNLLYVGAWRNRYSLVRQRLLKSLRDIQVRHIKDLETVMKSYVYTSTIERSHLTNLQNNILITALAPRDTPKIDVDPDLPQR